MIAEAVITAGDYSRKVWVEGDPSSTRLCLFLDAELYLDRVDALPILREVELASTAVLFLSNQDAASRHADYTCNPSYSKFIVGSVVAWAKDRFPDLADGGHTICGLSLSGLAAAFAALHHPTVFAKVLCQSGSFWWQDEWLSKNVPMAEGRYWLSVGDEELATGVTHPPSGLRQEVSQLKSVQNAATALASKGAEVKLNTYHGGHDPACWRAELKEALMWSDRTDL